MKIVFLNVWHARREKELREFIKEQRNSTDVFCFQEACDKAINCIEDLQNEYELYRATKVRAADEIYYMATYVKSPIKVISVNSILEDSPRSGIGLNTTFVYNGKTYNICNVHGLPRPGHKLDTPERIYQFQAFIDHYKTCKDCTIIGGDFNVDIKTQSIRLFSENGYEDLIQQYNVKTTRNRLAWELYPAEKKYYSDYVFVSHGLKPSNFKVIENEISDHLPLIVEF